MIYELQKTRGHHCFLTFSKSLIVAKSQFVASFQTDLEQILSKSRPSVLLYYKPLLTEH